MKSPKLITLGKKIDALSKLGETGILTMDELVKINSVLTEMHFNDPIFDSVYKEHFQSTLKLLAKKAYSDETILAIPKLKQSMIKNGEFVMLYDKEEKSHYYDYIEAYIDTVAKDRIIRHHELALIIDKDMEFVKFFEKQIHHNPFGIDIYWHDITSYVYSYNLK